MYEAIFKHALFPAYEKFVRHRGTAQYLAEYEKSQWFDNAALRQLQLAKLNALLDHAWRTVPFLGSFWRDHGLQPRELADISELESYPLLTKPLVTANYQNMISSAHRGRTLTKLTGGSTGDPFRLEYTMESYARRTAAMWRGYGWAGAGLGARTAYLWGTGQRQEGWGAIKDKMYHGAFNRRFFDAFAMRDDNIDSYIDAIREYEPDAVIGYVAPIVLVARRMNRRGMRFARIRGVLTGAEALYEPERRDIEQAFGCKVFNTYGCREFMLIAAECAAHRGLHVNVDHLVVETVDSSGRNVHGLSGDVAVTDLHNYGMPFVRFLNGDCATYSDEQCSCGRGLPILTSVDGRVLDIIVTPDGRQLPGEFFVAVFLEHPTIKQWQVVQVAPDEIEYRLVMREPLSQEQRAKLEIRTRSTVGDVMRLTIREVGEISTTRSGKRRLTVALASTAAFAKATA